jgi:hypothetical protein
MRKLPLRRRAAATPSPDELERLVRRVAGRRAREVIDVQKRAVDRVERDLGVVRVDLDCIASDLRAIEERLDAGTAGAAPVSGDDDANADARRVLDEVRAEHARIRARLQVVSRYEERIRRLEEAVVKLYGGDLRGPRVD